MAEKPSLKRSTSKGRCHEKRGQLRLNPTETADWLTIHGAFLKSGEGLSNQSAEEDVRSIDPPSNDQRFYDKKKKKLYELDRCRPMAHFREKEKRPRKLTNRQLHRTFYRASDGSILQYRRTTKPLSLKGWAMLTVFGTPLGAMAGWLVGMVALLPFLFVDVLPFSPNYAMPVFITLGAIAPLGFAIYATIKPELHKEEVRKFSKEKLRRLLRKPSLQSVDKGALKELYPESTLLYSGSGEGVRALFKVDDTFKVLTDAPGLETYVDQEEVKKYLLEQGHDSAYHAAFGELPTVKQH